MKILVLAGAYPHPGHPFAGTFNEKSALALRRHCEALVVLSPRPFAPRFLRIHPRWNAYSQIPSFQVREQIPVVRPAVPVIPRLGSSLWIDSSAYVFIRKVARQLHSRFKFDAIMSFDLGETGGVAWRLGRYLEIPASGWASGEDVKYPKSSALAAVVRRAIQNLSCVFYQTEELLARGRDLLGDTMTPEVAQRQSVLPHGIPDPPVIARERIRKEVRTRLGIRDEEILVLNVSRMTRAKGIFELLDAFDLAVTRNPLMRGVWIGAKPGFDDSRAADERIRATASLQGMFSLLPACNPDKVWEYLCAADIFAFPSHREGMSNSLLEAMVMNVPAVAFAIPSNCEIDAGTGVLRMVPPFDVRVFSEQLTYLSFSPETRASLGQLGATLVGERFRAEKNMEQALRRISGMVRAEA
jgi:teichuronic acid biosynthesis glycosyltransferase TuaC